MADHEHLTLPSMEERSHSDRAPAEDASSLPVSARWMRPALRLLPARPALSIPKREAQYNSLAYRLPERNLRPIRFIPSSWHFAARCDSGRQKKTGRPFEPCPQEQV
jgi:hypothetical protein